MAKFHINKHGKPAICNAEHGNCPLGDTPHFNNRKEAEEFLHEISSDEYGLLPKVQTMSDEWQRRFLSYSNPNQLIKEQAREIMSDNLFSSNPGKETLKTWKDLHYSNSEKDFKEVSETEAIRIIEENIEPNILTGWFREYNSDYKPEIERLLITNPEVRNASMNIAFSNYKKVVEEDISFDSFLEKEIELHRGGNISFIENDVFISYAFDEKVAQKFSSRKKNSETERLIVRMKDTLGSLQTTGETEVMVRRT